MSFEFNEPDVAKNINCLILAENDAEKRTTDWLENNFPITPWGRIDWENVTKKNIIKTNNDDKEIAKYAAQFLRTVSPSKMIVFWDDVSIAPIEVDAKEVIDNIGKIILESFDTWIIPVDSKTKWCVEIYHEGEVCYGESN